MQTDCERLHSDTIPPVIVRVTESADSILHSRVVKKKLNFGKVCGLTAHVVRNSFLSSMMSFVVKNIDP